jgi:hypothetical protein
MLLLHLADEAGTRHLVPVLRDSLPPSDYRTLRVAIGTLWGRPERAATTSEIL